MRYAIISIYDLLKYDFWNKYIPRPTQYNSYGILISYMSNGWPCGHAIKNTCQLVQGLSFPENA